MKNYVYTPEVEKAVHNLYQVFGHGIIAVVQSRDAANLPEIMNPAIHAVVEAASGMRVLSLEEQFSYLMNRHGDLDHLLMCQRVINDAIKARTQ